MTLADLTTMVNAVCPIYGLNSNGVISFKLESTPDQRIAAQAIVDANIKQVIL